MSVELNVTIKDSEKRLSKDFLIYEEIKMSLEDPIIEKCVKEVLEEFNGEPEDIKVKALLILQ